MRVEIVAAVETAKERENNLMPPVVSTASTRFEPGFLNVCVLPRVIGTQKSAEMHQGDA